MTPEAIERTARRTRSAFDLSAGSAGSLFPVVLALVFLALHLPYLPASLEDLDSINFALGIRQFDVAHHQPHPPGYPVFMLIAKAIRVAVSSEATALGLVSVVAGTLGVLAMAALYRRLDGRARHVWSLAAVGVAMTSPLYWFTAVRPLSDVSGLAAALGVQAMTLGATSTRALAMAGLCAGVGAGLRSQVAWLTVPLLIMRGVGTGGWGLGRTSLVLVLFAFLGGVLVWFVPLVIITGGPAAYWRVLFNQGAEDIGNITMLWTTHNLRAAADALYYALVAPWATWAVAIVMLALAAVGLVWMSRREGRALVALAVAFGPYLVFDLLFQETFTGRYALPLVMPIAYAAIAGLRLLPRQSGLLVAIGIGIFDAHAAGTSIAAYARQKAPAFRLLDDMASAAHAPGRTPVLAMDRRNALDFRRPIVWADGVVPLTAQQLLAPPQHEWLEAVKYWNSGRRAPVWFVVDPKRTSVDLVQHDDPVRYRWGLPYPELVSGARPDEMDWYRVDRPEWYVGEGWALTPEAAGVAEADHRGLAYGPIDGWLSADTPGGALLMGGRNLDPSVRPRLSVTIDGIDTGDVEVPPGPFLHTTTVPAGLPTQDHRVQLAVTPPARVAIEQFDASARRIVFGFGNGWHEQEFSPTTGLRWRWLSERGELLFRWPYRSPSKRMTLHIEGESPRKYFPRESVLAVRYGSDRVFVAPLSSDFSLDITINTPIGEGVPQPIVLETDQVFAPADRSRRTQDRRHLGLRIFKLEVRAEK